MTTGFSNDNQNLSNWDPFDAGGPKDAVAEPVQAKKARHKKKKNVRLRRTIAVLMAVAVLLIVVFAIWYEGKSDNFTASGPYVVVNIKSGESFGSVVSTLIKQHVIATQKAYRAYEFFHGTPSPEPGVYAINRHSSFSHIGSIFSLPPNSALVGVIPGDSIGEVELTVSAISPSFSKTFDAAIQNDAVPSPFADKSSFSYEGLLGVGTYRVLPGEKGTTLLSQMVARFTKEAGALGIHPTSKVSGFNSYQIITIASIAIKEGYFNKYFGNVARIVENRLARTMRLEMTATIQYGLGRDGGGLSTQDRQKTTPYNTYLHGGLTPTPICEVTSTALRAVLHPPQGNWLYFVAEPNGTTLFATTYTEQIANEKIASNQPRSSDT